MLFGYVGPEVALPLSSFAAIVLGIVFAFWQRIFKWIRWGAVGLVALCTGKSASRPRMAPVQPSVPANTESSVASQAAAQP